MIMAVLAVGFLAAASGPAAAAVAPAAATQPAAHPTASASLPQIAKLKPVGGASSEASEAVNPECILFYMNQRGKPGGLAHISSFLKTRSVKINAEIQCRRVSMNLVLHVTLWKTGLIPHSQDGPTTASAAKGNQLKNQKTFRKCLNRTKSTFYGTAAGSVVFQGVTYSGSLQSGKATLACGT
jgi:hypothetical protein